MNPMLRPTLAAAALIACVIAFGQVKGFGATALKSCRSKSVDEKTYVAKNESLLRGLPLPRGSRLVSSRSVGQPAPDSCFPHDAGPPYASFMTVHTYRLPAGTNRVAVLQWFERKLKPPAWNLVSGSPSTYALTFHHRRSSLAVQTWRGGIIGFSLSANYALLHP
jgi:hypothetical protein